jgi:hypothetical protein
VTVRTYLGPARERARAEREALAAKVDAFDRFVDEVSAIEVDVAGGSTAGMTATTGPRLQGRSSSDDCRRVRNCFAETVRPHSVADVEDPEPLLATIRTEFTDSIAVALAPTTEASFSGELKRAILSEARSRQAEADTLRRGIEREEDSLEAAAGTVETATDWVVRVDETPLSELGFEALRERHETLSAHRRRCDELARERQDFLVETTSHNADTGVRNREMIPFLYRELPVDHPVLATVARLDDVCRECQRTVRAHLTRRG